MRAVEHTPACVICPVLPGRKNSLSDESRLCEALGLAASVNLDVLYHEAVHMRAVRPSTFFGGGFIENIKHIAEEKQIGLMVVDTDISPVQQRNLEKALNMKVIDRTALILEIFGERASTREGVLQVELAHLTYQRSRLVRSWTHLERQRGGAGFLGGPGETQIELDRRLIDARIVKIRKELEKVKRTRGIQRGARAKVPYFIAALAGYTNAGKSTLFNRLSDSSVTAADMLFATLDPTMRKITLPHGTEVILSDTVGFISDLPTELIMAFRATLEEVLNADIILHVRDISDPDTASRRTDVLEVLDQLGVKINRDNYIEVLNKADLLGADELKHLRQKTTDSKNSVLISAENGGGCDKLLKLLEDKLTSKFIKCKVSVPASDGKTVSWLYDRGRVLKAESKDGVNVYTVSVSKDDLSRLKHAAESDGLITVKEHI